MKIETNAPRKFNYIYTKEYIKKKSRKTFLGYFIGTLSFILLSIFGCTIDKYNIGLAAMMIFFLMSFLISMIIFALTISRNYKKDYITFEEGIIHFKKCYHEGGAKGPGRDVYKKEIIISKVSKIDVTDSFIMIYGNVEYHTRNSTFTCNIFKLPNAIENREEFIAKVRKQIAELKINSEQAVSCKSKQIKVHACKK